MHDVLIFISGALFTLILVALSLVLAFRITDYKENLEVARERKRKAFAIKNTAKGGVLIPKTLEERQLEKDEEFQAFTDLLNKP